MAAINAKSSALLATEALSMPKSLNKTLSKACGKFEKRICSEISFKDFMDFLHTAYQVNEAIEGVPNYLTGKHDIDWQNIAINEFASSLLVMKEDNSNPKASLETFSEMTDKEVLNTSLTKQSKNAPNRYNMSSGNCNELEENVYE
jgi:oligoendopeptidase F